MPDFTEELDTESETEWMEVSFTSDVDETTYTLPYVPANALANEIHAACLKKSNQELACGYTKLVLSNDTGVIIHTGDPQITGKDVKIKDLLDPNGEWKHGKTVSLKIKDLLDPNGEWKHEK